VQGIGSMSELAHMDHPAIRQFFDGPRARAAQEAQRPDAQTDSGNRRTPSKPK
jgi:phospholipid/cholesterol/gamma-HCH transport system ATP-binding protein